MSQPRPGDELPSIPVRKNTDRELWVGLFVMIGLAAIVAALFLFTQPALFRGRYTMATVVANAAGIRHGDPVEIRGVVVGRVVGFDIAQDGVHIRLEIERRYKVPIDSTVRLESGGLLGGMIANIDQGQSPVLASKDTVLPGTSQAPAVENVNRIVSQSEQIASRLQTLLSDDTVKSIQMSSAELSQLLVRLNAIAAEQQSEINRITESLGRSAENVERLTGSPNAKNSLTQIDRATASIQAAAQSLRGTTESLNVVLERMREGHGTLGLLSSDESLYVNANGAVMSLGETAASLRKLADDVRANPSRYIHVRIF